MVLQFYWLRKCTGAPGISMLVVQPRWDAVQEARYESAYLLSRSNPTTNWDSFSLECPPLLGVAYSFPHQLERQQSQNLLRNTQWNHRISKRSTTSRRAARSKAGCSESNHVRNGEHRPGPHASEGDSLQQAKRVFVVEKQTRYCVEVGTTPSSPSELVPKTVVAKSKAGQRREGGGFAPLSNVIWTRWGPSLYTSRNPSVGLVRNGHALPALETMTN
ncbi:hypothetical protein BKA70DRAFT_218983 [Coprinopsis sp. MPI-PUGE-AT-0042]|nr:hypothetical protein BKA70DRAFT_218983 [Coprinopsis sp. MPI-PUGE-AT-0042]